MYKRLKIGISDMKLASELARLLQPLKIWENSGKRMCPKLKLFNSIVILILLYGCESWIGLREIKDRVRRSESRCLWTIMKIRLCDMVGEEELRRRTGQQTNIEKLTH